MTVSAPPDWHEANQRYLSASLAVVRNWLRQGSETQSRDALEAQAALEESRLDLPGPSALDMVSSVFELSPFEREVVLLCAGVELDSAFADRVLEAQGDGHRPFPTFSLAMAVLPDAHWSALAPDGPLRRWRLIEVTAGDALTTSPLRIDERLLHYLTGVSQLDERLRGFVEPIHDPGELPASHEALVEHIHALVTREDGEGYHPLILLGGTDRTAKRTVAAAACLSLGMQLHVMHAADIPVGVPERESLARLWEREAALDGGALLIDAEDAPAVRAVAAFLDAVHALVFVSSREVVTGPLRPFVRVNVEKPKPAERRALWRQALGAVGEQLDGRVQVVVSQFDLDRQGIQTVSAEVLARSRSEPTDRLGDVLWNACRLKARGGLNDLAQRIDPAATWDDLVLPEPQRRLLRDIAAHVRHRSTVYDTWGFVEKGTRGLGISALFSGASGTGKTMAAEVLANELALDLYRIDLSQVVSKYIGETEKNLSRVFEAAEVGGAILLFDEADALFGKRSEVKDSHDRYANIEVSYLLQRMEAYRGLAILTTNMKSALDTAFLRRIRFAVQFPFPDMASRAEIWRRIYPAATPTDALDPQKLAKLSLSGGNIKNVAMNAAFLAAEAGEPVRPTHVLRAARTEYAKIEKPLTDAEVAGWS